MQRGDNRGANNVGRHTDDGYARCNNTPIGTPAASDGSVISLSGTYGRTISLKDKTRISSCRGKAYGYPMTSHRAEAYGICARDILYEI